MEGGSFILGEGNLLGPRFSFLFFYKRRSDGVRESLGWHGMDGRMNAQDRISGITYFVLQRTVLFRLFGCESLTFLGGYLRQIDSYQWIRGSLPITS